MFDNTVRNQKTIISKYPLELKELWGSGTFGKIYIYYHKNVKMAIKEFITQPQTHPTIIREIKAMQSVKSPYVLEIHNIIVHKLKIYMLVDFFEKDLFKMLPNSDLTLNDIRHILWQILKGVEEIHKKEYIHRDLKTANILIKKRENNIDDVKRIKISESDEKISFCKEDIYPFKDSNYKIKICDFGMARTICKEMTPQVFTLWYRAPEVLCGATDYQQTADIWSIGCIFGELITKKPIFKANTEIESLKLISSILGPITADCFISAPVFEIIEGDALEIPFWNEFENLSVSALDLAKNMLAINPSQRFDVEKCLSHDFFTNFN